MKSNICIACGIWLGNFIKLCFDVIVMNFFTIPLNMVSQRFIQIVESIFYSFEDEINHIDSLLGMHDMFVWPFGLVMVFFLVVLLFFWFGLFCSFFGLMYMRFIETNLANVKGRFLFNVVTLWSYSYEKSTFRG